MDSYKYDAGTVLSTMLLKLEIACDLVWDLGKDSDSVDWGGSQVAAFLINSQGVLQVPGSQGLQVL